MDHDATQHTQEATANDMFRDFVPVNLGDDNDDDNSRANSGTSIDNNVKQSAKETKRQRTSAHAETTLLQVRENSIQHCFLLAVDAHDQPPQASWSWETLIAEKQNDDYEMHPTAAAVLDPEKERRALESWEPRPLFLPTWAIGDEGLDKATAKGPDTGN